MNQVIELTEHTAVIQTATPRDPGAKVDLKVKLPDGVLATHLVIPGTVTRCEFMNNDGDSRYVLEMKIGKMPSIDQKILVAYREFLERKKVLAKVKVDLNQIQEAFEAFGHNLRQLRETAEELRHNLRGTLELMKVKADNNTTIH
jgi:predicted RecB family nuclease